MFQRILAVCGEYRWDHMQRRFVASGALVGLILGIIASLLFPNLLTLGLDFNRSFNQATGYPRDFHSEKGSVFNSLLFAPILFGLIGGLLGFTIYKLKSVIKK
ncbi:hypothetical protein M1146_00270 [Patescibacteria group bacterium]|nr:hypothetical protein [Patescibacteria group bacterium]